MLKYVDVGSMNIQNIEIVRVLTLGELLNIHCVNMLNILGSEYSRGSLDSRPTLTPGTWRPGIWGYHNNSIIIEQLNSD